MFENRSIFDEVKAYEVKAYKKCQFFGPPCTYGPAGKPHMYRVAQKAIPYCQ